MSTRKGQDYVLGIDSGPIPFAPWSWTRPMGRARARAVSAYKRWAKAEFCDPRSNRFRQHPLDYVEGIEDATKRALAEAGARVAAKIRGHHYGHDGLDALSRRRDGDASGAEA